MSDFRGLRRSAVLAATICILCLTPAMAAVKLPAIIGSHMVLQASSPLTIWGWADPGEDVMVTFGDTKASAKADGAGKWLVKLPAMQASDQPREMTIVGKNTIQLTDILVGEVWLASGQSNMEWSVAASDNPETEIKAADHPKIRLFLVPKVPSRTPANDVQTAWTVCTPDTVKNFSAVAYFFGRELHQKLESPVGMIASSWGGTRIEPWTPPEGFADAAELEGERKQIEAMRDSYQTALKNALPQFKAWVEAAEKAAAGGTEIGDPPAAPADPYKVYGAPTALYNGMIHPLVPFAIRGALWYQGESNRGQAMHYHDLMKALIRGWRTVWGQGNFPFLYVQLAPFRYDNNVTALPEIWEAQTATLAVPNTGMAVTTDIGNVSDIHPRNKQEVGRRLARWALANTYGKTDVVFSGPTYESLAVDGKQIRLKFKHAHGGLAARDGKPLTWFSVAGADKKFVKANATIDGETVLVESPEVASPVAVRFGWHQLAEPNLMNKAGLPAVPFRTDEWKDAVSAPAEGQ
ncbi:MAG TPA: sialate O-acetylesterase [Pirellulales bacterium]|nr:sialate O-acetylesterase [Pirellulales bacterium]